MFGRRLHWVLISLLNASTFTAWPAVQESNRDGAATSRKAESTRDEDAAKFDMTKARACLSIDGYQKYELLPDSKLTADEKLLIYYEPLGYKTVVKGGKFVVHLTQDGQIRKKGQKVVLRRKKNILDYEGKSEDGLGFVYLRNSVALKGLPPGDYEYDIILRDEQNPGQTATQSLPFRIIAAANPATPERRGR